MLKNYLKIAFRSLARSKSHSIINVLGLGIGIAACVLIVLFVRDEWTFDKFHAKADRIYRVYGYENWGEKQEFFYTTTPFPMGPTLKENLPEVEYQVRINKIGTQVKVGADQFTETVTIVGQDFFEVFDFKLLAGDEKSVMRSSESVVITKTMAQKYFGAVNPIDKIITIQLNDTFKDFSVKAVAEDIPINSSIQFYLMISDLNYTTLYNERTLTSAWFNINPETYVLLQEGATEASVEAKFPSIFRTVLGEDDFKKSKYAPGLQPVTSIHLDTSFPASGLSDVSDPKYAYILAAIALLILSVACINFVTLSVGRSIKRAKEVGIRKVVGAERSQLMFQFVGEAVIITMISLIVGILLATLSVPLFNDLSGKNLSLRPEAFMFGVGLVMITIIGLFAGSYPAFVLSNFKPISILKGKVQAGSSKQGLRKILVGVQLVLSIFLISSTLVMRDQLSFLQNKNLGFNKEQMAVIPINVARGGKRLAERVNEGFIKAEAFKAEFAKVAGIAASCASSHDFGDGAWVNIGYTDDKGTYRTFDFNSIDDDYISVMKMEMALGRNFSAEVPSDKRRSVIVNEAFAGEMGWKDALGKKIPGKNFPDHEVIGVVKDFNYSSLYTKVTPLVMVMDPAIILAGMENINVDSPPIPKLLVRLSPGNMTKTIEEIKGIWDAQTGGEEFTFSFVDQALAAQYRNDQNLGRIVSIATLLAIVIGSLGLYALASLAMQNRTKEISIRKVMGATEQSLLVLLSSDYVILIGFSLVLSVPITYYLMNTWLQTFEYRIAIGWEVFALAGALSFVVAILTISYQAIKTAWTRPAETLKYE